MNFYVNIDGGGNRKSGTIHTKGCPWTNPVVKASLTEFWFGTLTLNAARRIAAGLNAEENIHTFCIDRETLLPRVRETADPTTEVGVPSMGPVAEPGEQQVALPITNLELTPDGSERGSYFLTIRTRPGERLHFFGSWAVFHRLKRTLLDLPDSEPLRQPYDPQ